MRMVKYFFRSVLLLVIVWLMCGKSTPAMASATVWSDSLRVSIVDSTVISSMGSDYLQFTIVIERLNADWNTPTLPDTVLGNSDLYFYANFEAFEGDPVFIYVHDSLSTGSPGGPGKGHPDAILQANVGVWAERLNIALTRQDPGHGNPLIGVTTNANAKYKLKLTVGKVDTLCTVQWKLRNPKAVNLGIKWDFGEHGSTGLQSFGGNPIIETLTGDIEKLPSDLLDVDCMENTYWACEGEPLSIGLHAESTGIDSCLIFEWYDSIPGGDRAYPILSSATTQDQTTSGGKRYTYDYSFSQSGDTLYIDRVTGSIDSIYFFCLVRDTSLTSKPEAWCGTQLMVRDSIKGFVSPLSDLYTLNKIDTVTKCAGQETVSVRFNFFGISEDELQDLDSIYMEYRNDPCDGNPMLADTVSCGTSTLSASTALIDGMPVFYWQAEVKGKGKIFIQKIWTRYCENAATVAEYDTLVVIEDSLQMLPRVTVASKESVKIDTVGSTVFTFGSPIWPTGFTSLRDLASSITKGPLGKLPFTYTAKDTTGLDTVLYIMPGDQCAYMREVEVQELKYLTLKVYLWGAWRETSNSMYAFMGNVNNLIRFSTMMDLNHAYYVSPYNSDYKITTNRLREIVQDRQNNGELGFVDWVEVSLVEATPNTGSAQYPFNITKKIDTVSCFLREDGIVCDTAGNPYISFKNLPANDYYVVVRHRNHLGIMTNTSITLASQPPLSSNPVMVDFTSTIAPVSGMMNIAYLKPPTQNNYFMFVGDVDSNGKITVSDRNKIQINKNSNMDYYVWDIDFNLRVNISDINTWGDAKKKTASGYSNPTQAFVW